MARKIDATEIQPNIGSKLEKTGKFLPKKWESVLCDLQESYVLFYELSHRTVPAKDFFHMKMSTSNFSISLYSAISYYTLQHYKHINSNRL